MVRELFEKVLQEYKSSMKENFTEHPLKSILTTKIPEFLMLNLENPDQYKVSGSAGQGVWTYLPWIAIMDKKITVTPQRGYYIVYLFREDMKGVYLSLNQGMTEIKNKEGTVKTKEILKNTAIEYRNIIGNINSNYSKDIDLRAKNSPAAPFYEAGNIYAKYYEWGNIPSDEDLLSDLNELLFFYESISKHTKLKIIDNPEEILNAQNKLNKLYQDNSDEIVPQTKFGFNNNVKNTYWNNNLGISFSSEELEDRFLNGIGTIKPSSGNKVSISCGINIPKKGINRMVSGALVKDAQNNIYVVYRGRLGGGFYTKVFKENYNGKWTKIQDGNRITDMVVIGCLDDPNFLLKLKEFILEVDRIKNNNEKLKTITTLKEIQHAQELFKTRFTEVTDEIIEATTQKKRLKLQWSSKLGIWGYFGDVENHYFNPFGIGKPNLHEDNQTICEINSPHEGINKLTSGFFAKNSSGEMYLLNRGNFHNIKVKKDDSSWNWVEIEDGTDTTDAILIGGLDEPDFNENLKNFVFNVRNMKNEGSGVDEKSVDNISFFEYLTKEGYIFDKEVVENYLLSLKVKPFVILTGNSGTGKTKLAQLFAQYLNNNNDIKELNSFYDKKYEIVPVGANWTENRHILGFYNVITGEYEKTCSLDLILKAEQDLEVPYFLILDEMNLSYVERYFSDFLSGMESKEAIPLHNNDIKYVPTGLELPKNLLVIGTVNVDETTYMFSPKVLDRANTLEFLTPSASDYMHSQISTEKLDGRIKYLENPLSNIDIRKEQIIDLKEKMKDIDTEDGKFWELVTIELENFQEILKKAGFDFGFRVINEIMRFMYVAWVYEGQDANWNNWKRYFDAQIKQKMLPKIHGSQRTLENVLSELSDRCSEYPSSKLKLDQMEEILKKQRYVSYTN